MIVHVVSSDNVMEIPPRSAYILFLILCVTPEGKKKEKSFDSKYIPVADMKGVVMKA